MPLRRRPGQQRIKLCFSPGGFSMHVDSKLSLSRLFFIIAFFNGLNSADRRVPRLEHAGREDKSTSKGYSRSEKKPTCPLLSSAGEAFPFLLEGLGLSKTTNPNKSVLKSSRMREPTKPQSQVSGIRSYLAVVPHQTSSIHTTRWAYLRSSGKLTSSQQCNALIHTRALQKRESLSHPQDRWKRLLGQVNKSIPLKMQESAPSTRIYLEGSTWSQ